MNTYHLDSFNIGAFRGLDNMTFERLGRFNLLIGGNNSGKTSVLEALRIFCNPQNPDEFRRIASGRVSRTPYTQYGLPACLLWMFSCRKTDNGSIEAAPIRLSGQGTCSVRSLEIGNAPLEGLPSEEEMSYFKKRGVKFEAAPEATMSGIQISMLPEFSNGSEFLPSEEIVQRYWVEIPILMRREKTGLSLPSAFIKGYEHLSSELPMSRFSELSREQEQELITLARLFDPHIKDIRIRVEKTGLPRLSIEHDSLGEAPLMTFGDGMRRVMFIASSLFAARDGFLFLDELESGIHAFILPEVMKWLFKAARTMNIQIFATTHSLEAVDAVLSAAKDTPEEFVTYRLSREDHIAKRLNFNLLTDLRVRGGLEIR